MSKVLMILIMEMVMQLVPLPLVILQAITTSTFLRRTHTMVVDLKREAVGPNLMMDRHNIKGMIIGTILVWDPWIENDLWTAAIDKQCIIFF